MTDSSDDILTDAQIEQLKNQKGGIEFGAGSNIISGGNLPGKDYGDIVGAINALIPTGLGTDVNANLDALNALMNSNNVDFNKDFRTAFSGNAGDTLNYLGVSDVDGMSAESIAASIRDAAFKQLDEIFKSDMTDEEKRIAGSEVLTIAQIDHDPDTLDILSKTDKDGFVG